MKSKALRRATERVRNARGRFVAKEEQDVRASVCTERDDMVKRLGPLSCEEVCAIVLSCHQHGVASLKFRGLELAFQPKVSAASEFHEFDETNPPVTAEETAQRVHDARRALRELDGASAQPADNLAGIRADNFEVAEDEVEMLMVTDPVAYEKAMNRDPEYENAKPS